MKIEVYPVCHVLAVQLPPLYLYFIAPFVFKLLAEMATYLPGCGVFSVVHARRSRTSCHRAAFS